MFLEYGLHPLLQRWVIGQCLCTNQRSLASYGIRQDGDTAFLYLLSASHAHLTRQHLQQDQESVLLHSSLPHSSHNSIASQEQRLCHTLPPRLNSGDAGEWHSWFCGPPTTPITCTDIFPCLSAKSPRKEMPVSKTSRPSMWHCLN